MHQVSTKYSFGPLLILLVTLLVGCGQKSQGPSNNGEPPHNTTYNSVDDIINQYGELSVEISSTRCRFSRGEMMHATHYGSYSSFEFFTEMNISAYCIDAFIEGRTVYYRGTSDSDCEVSLDPFFAQKATCKLSSFMGITSLDIDFNEYEKLTYPSDIYVKIFSESKLCADGMFPVTIEDNGEKKIDLPSDKEFFKDCKINNLDQVLGKEMFYKAHIYQCFIAADKNFTNPNNNCDLQRTNGKDIQLTLTAPSFDFL